MKKQIQICLKVNNKEERRDLVTWTMKIYSQFSYNASEVRGVNGEELFLINESQILHLRRRERELTLQVRFVTCR